MLATGEVRSPSLAHYAMPRQPDGNRVVDAGEYGIVFNTRGVAIGSLQDTFDKIGETSNNVIVDTTVENTLANVVHTPTITVDDVLQTGLQVELWRILDWVDEDKNY